MKKILLLCFVITLALPAAASAHASPVEYSPRSSEEMVSAPSEVRIRFSERLESGASRIVVKNESGTEIQSGNARVDAADPHVLLVPIQAGAIGTYVVSWGVVSSDDGHFTKGEYPYFVGVSSGAAPAQIPQVQIVQSSAVPEAATIFVELLGNSFLWGALVLWLIILRRTAHGADPLARARVEWFVSCAIAAGVALILLGGGLHVLLKVRELAALHGIPIREALQLFIGTASGTAVVVRSLTAVGIACVFFPLRRRVFTAVRITGIEIALFVLLFVFAYFRSKISHATANPFYPEFSVAINFIQLIGKGLWEGIIGGVSMLYLMRVTRPLISRMLPAVFRILAIAFGATAASASYIVWLHLHDITNLTSTLWGERFVPLLVSALFAVLLLAYHIAWDRFRPHTVSRYLAYTLPAEFACGVLVVFFSSLMIITSPPIAPSSVQTFRAVDNGVKIELSSAPYEDGMALLSIKSSHELASDPTIFIGSDEGLLVDAKKRFEGGYVFPVSIFAESVQPIRITVQQKGSYDAHALFDVSRHDVSAASEDAGRHFDLLALICSGVALLSVFAALVLYRLAAGFAPLPESRNSLPRYVAGFVGALLIVSQFMWLGMIVLGNSFKSGCIADGNAWHLMLPAKNGVPVSSRPQEGCMALGGSFHIADKREYAFLRNPGASEVKFATDLNTLRAGKPVDLQFRITDAAGNPALLSVQHERLVHVIVISADMREFWHVHPDDAASLSSESVKNANFHIPFTFPRAGEYVIGIDYAHGLTAESKFVKVRVSGADAQGDTATYPLSGTFEGFNVSLETGLVLAGQPTTLLYRITKDGKDVTDLAPYLAAAMHVAIVKNDLSEFMHTHGEVHVPGAPKPVVTSSTVHNHAPPPPRFGPLIEAHPIFTTPGLYTVFGQFMQDGKVITSRFTVRVE